MHRRPTGQLPDVPFISAIHAAIVALIRRTGKLFDADHAVNNEVIHRNRRTAAPDFMVSESMHRTNHAWIEAGKGAPLLQV
jgi:hypothetical protein